MTIVGGRHDRTRSCAASGHCEPLLGRSPMPALAFVIAREVLLEALVNLVPVNGHLEVVAIENDDHAIEGLGLNAEGAVAGAE
jgi:hypothetical protein